MGSFAIFTKIIYTTAQEKDTCDAIRKKLSSINTSHNRRCLLTFFHTLIKHIYSVGGAGGHALCEEARQNLKEAVTPQENP